MAIDGFAWFVGAIVICGVHGLYLRSWQREQRQRQAWWQQYDVSAQQRHEVFMDALDRSASHVRGQA